MSPRFKLIDLIGRGLADVVRLVLVCADVEFEDVRLTDEEWKIFISKTPFGFVPLLEFDGQQICQTRAMARFVAHEYNLVGCNALESAKIDMIVDSAYDMIHYWHKIKSEEDGVRRRQLLNTYEKLVLPDYLDHFEKHLIYNSSGSGYIIGDNLTWADLSVCQSLQIINEKCSNALDDRQLLRDYSDRIFNLPKIKAYLDKPPVTEL